jgi:hypothetical protein
MPIKTLHREDVEKLVSLTYTQTPGFILNGVAHKCRALKVDSFDDAIKFLKDNAGRIVYFDQPDHYEDEFSVGEANGFIVRYAETGAETRAEDGPCDEVDPAVENRKKMMAKIRNLVDIAGTSGNWNCNPYLHGMFNGMELILSILEDREVKYKDAPKVWLDDMPKTNQSPVAVPDAHPGKAK